MTTFLADLRIYRRPDQHYITPSIQLSADSIPHALDQIMAWGIGLSVSRLFESLAIEAIYTSKRRGVEYLSFLEASSTFHKFLSSSEGE